MKLTLIEKKQEVPNVVTFILKPEQLLTWKPGQFMRYHIDDPNPDERLNNRFFTISSAPYEENIHLTSKFVPGDGSSFKKDLLKLSVGDKVEATGPSGEFIVPDVFISEGKKLCFIAGGIGITPFRSIILDLNQKKLPINITLLYANRDQNIVFKNELEEIVQRGKSLNIEYFINPKRIDGRAIKALPDLKSYIFYVSGPEPMVEAMEKMLYALKIPEENVVRDYFPGYKEI